MRSQDPILLVEDDRVDAMTVMRALAEINVSNQLEIVSNGEQALEFLRDEKNGNPALILLDLNMPRMNGIEFLRIAKQDNQLRKIPVIVLTTSKEERDRAECFKMSVAGYMVKPIDYQQFVEMIRAINLYWTLSELPE